MKRLMLLLLICSGAPLAYAQNLTKAEKAILKEAEKLDAASIDFLERVVNVNSGTLNFEGVRENGRLFANAFSEIGFDTTWYDLSEVNRAGHLFAERKGRKGKRLLLIGHLDTVFDRDSPFQKFERKGDMAHAPGGNDMKGGNVVLLYALKALYNAGYLKNTQIIVALHGDEESAGKPLTISRRDIINAAKRSDVALGFETATGFDYATVARRGSSGWTLKVTGKQAHSSGIFSENTGAGAVFEAARILHTFYDQLREEELLTFNPGLIGGGTRVAYDGATSTMDIYGKTNIVASGVTVKGGLRFISEEQKEKARENMRQIVNNGNLPQTSATISFQDSYPAMSPTEGNMQLLKQLSQLSEDMGFGEVKAYDPGRRGAADISFVAAYVDGLDGLGTMGTGAHSPSETVDLSTMNDLIKRTALFLYRLTR
ncbi:MAG: M20/M25/M40 family metallo-hydrolase [Bacteroidota bacterium]